MLGTHGSTFPWISIYLEGSSYSWKGYNFSLSYPYPYPSLYAASSFQLPAMNSYRTGG